MINQTVGYQYKLALALKFHGTAELVEALLFTHRVVSKCFASRWMVARQAPLSLGFLGKDTGVGCHFLFQGIFPMEGSNPHLPH